MQTRENLRSTHVVLSAVVKGNGRVDCSNYCQKNHMITKPNAKWKTLLRKLQENSKQIRNVVRSVFCKPQNLLC